MVSVALLLVLSSPQKPILVSSKQLSGPIKVNEAEYPNYEFEYKWRTRSGKTYCVLYSWSGMDSSYTRLTFRSKIKSGTWLTTVLDDNADKGGDYFTKLVEFSDTRVKVELRSKGYAVFIRNSSGKWQKS